MKELAIQLSRNLLPIVSLILATLLILGGGGAVDGWGWFVLLAFMTAK